MALAAIIVLVLATLSAVAAQAFSAAGESADAGAATSTAHVTVESVLHISASLDAPQDAAARTWPMQVVGPGGEVVDRVRLSLAGDAPRASTTVEVPAPGDYTVRPLASPGIAASCSGDTLFAVRASTVGAVARFEIEPCPLPR